MPEYIRQLKDETSEASQHIAQVKSRIAVLEKEDPQFLADNHEIDVDYFDLKTLPQRARK
jgi:hypothetical protein